MKRNDSRANPDMETNSNVYNDLNLGGIHIFISKKAFVNQTRILIPFIGLVAVHNHYMASKANNVSISHNYAGKDYEINTKTRIMLNHLVRVKRSDNVINFTYDRWICANRQGS